MDKDIRKDKVEVRGEVNFVREDVREGGKEMVDARGDRKESGECKKMEGKFEELRRRGRPTNVERLGRERSESWDGRMGSENIEAFLKRKRDMSIEGEEMGLGWQRINKKVSMTREKREEGYGGGRGKRMEDLGR